MQSKQEATAHAVAARCLLTVANSTENVAVRRYDISSLHSFFLAGERLDPNTFEWMQKVGTAP